MPAKNEDLHGSVPENSPVALLIVDVINDLEFDGGEDLAEQSLPMAKRLRKLAEGARAAGIAVIYVNDNFGKWRSDFRALLDHCLKDDVTGQPLVKLLAPEKSDYFVLKPKHSAFFSTTLDTLLEYLHTKTVIITGLTTDRCVLFTAADAHMRDLHVFVPEDCCAAASAEAHDAALELLRRAVEADTRPHDQLDLAEMAASGATT
ncbi:MAG TPA: isochorismatase family cysteine hydrolase [Gemmatimonadaceae bacterium]|nr:isochorismatase family cysteine hydrolase [Gemmatimonadaceae bacterium]